MDAGDAIRGLEEAGILTKEEAARARGRLAPRPSPRPARHPAWALAGLVGGLLLAVLFMVGDAAATEPMPRQLGAALVIIIAGSCLATGLAWRTHTVAREAWILTGATLLATLDVMHASAPTWSLLPGVAVVWGSLAFEASPWMRGAMAFLAWPATAAFWLATPLDGADAGMATTVFVGLHLLLVWGMEPMGSPLRRVAPVPLLLGSLLVFATTAGFLVVGPTPGRFLALLIAAAVLVGCIMLVLNRNVRAYNLTVRRLPLP